MHNAGLFSAHA